MTRGMAWNSMVWLTLAVLASVLMACTDSTEDDTPSMLLSLSAAADTCLADPPDRASISHRGRGAMVARRAHADQMVGGRGTASLFH